MHDNVNRSVYIVKDTVKLRECAYTPNLINPQIDHIHEDPVGMMSLHILSVDTVDLYQLLLYACVVCYRCIQRMKHLSLC